MSDTLLADVIARPADEAPRLAYADWCEREGGEVLQARAEYIRGQIRIAHTPVESLRLGWEHALQSRLDQLHDRYARAWAGPLAPFASTVEFDLGFPAYVKVRAADLLQHGEEIFARGPIQHVDLTAVRDVTEELFSSKYLTGLRSLGMARCGLYDIHVRLLASSGVTAGLRWLSLANNHLGLGAAEALAESPHCAALQYTDFSGNPADPCEQVGMDAGVVVHTWLPPEGASLEERYGRRLEWLHRPNGAVSRYAL